MDNMFKIITFILQHKLTIVYAKESDISTNLKLISFFVPIARALTVFPPDIFTLRTVDVKKAVFNQRHKLEDRIVFVVGYNVVITFWSV